MEKKSNFVVKILVFIFLFFLFFFYNKYHISQIYKKESYYLYNIISSLENGDFKTAKYFSKQIFCYKSGDVYYDISCFLLYNFENDFKKSEHYKILILKNKKSFFKKLINQKIDKQKFTNL